ncbi:MAG: SprB repeat-containing protein, partial [Bacteroidota bacterium]
MKNILLTIAFLACFIYNAGAQTDPTNPQVICLQSVEPYEVDAPNGTPGSTYTWSVTSPGFTGSIISGQGTNEIMIDWGSTPIGTYVLQVIETNLGCPGLPVTLNIEITEITLTEGTSPVNCNGGTDGSADITVNGGVSPYSYIWSNGTTTEDLTGLAAGSYTVTVTDANQCTATISVLVTEPLAGLTSIAVP